MKKIIYILFLSSIYCQDLQGMVFAPPLQQFDDLTLNECLLLYDTGMYREYDFGEYSRVPSELSYRCNSKIELNNVLKITSFCEEEPLDKIDGYNFQDKRFFLLLDKNHHMLSSSAKNILLPELKIIGNNFNEFFKTALSQKNTERVVVGSTFNEDGYLTQLLAMNNPTEAEANLVKQYYYNNVYKNKKINRTIPFEKTIEKFYVSKNDLIDFYGGYSGIAKTNKSIEDLDLSLELKTKSVEMISLTTVKINATYEGSDDAIRYHKILKRDISFEARLENVFSSKNQIGTIENLAQIAGTKSVNILSKLNSNFKDFTSNIDLSLFLSKQERTDIIEKAKNDIKVIQLMIDDNISMEDYKNSEHYTPSCKEREIIAENPQIIEPVKEVSINRSKKEFIPISVNLSEKYKDVELVFLIVKPPTKGSAEIIKNQSCQYGIMYYPYSDSKGDDDIQFAVFPKYQDCDIELFIGSNIKKMNNIAESFQYNDKPSRSDFKVFQKKLDKAKKSSAAMSAVSFGEIKISIKR